MSAPSGERNGTATTNLPEGKPLHNGPAMAAFAAAGVGCAVLGILTMLGEAMPDLMKPLLNLYNPVGPLSGKTTFAVLAYIITWIVLGIAFRGKDVRLGRWLFISFALLGLGLLLTFPPFFYLFE